MRARGVVLQVTLAGVVVAVTFWLGWAAPVVCGAFAGVAGPALARSARDGGWPAALARAGALATLVGWGALLAFAAAGRGAPALVTALGGLAGVRGPVALGVTGLAALLTLALGAALAWAAATLTHGLTAAAASRAPERVTLSTTAVPARSGTGTPERAPAAHTP